MTGEHIHHHVHEHVQPVIQREVVAPQVVHTTVPIHETHHAAPSLHGTSVLPATTLEEFTRDRGTLLGRGATRLNEFDGCPKAYNRDLQPEQLEADKDLHLHAHAPGGGGGGGGGTASHHVAGAYVGGGGAVGSTDISGTGGGRGAGDVEPAAAGKEQALKAKMDGTSAASGRGGEGGVLNGPRQSTIVA